MARLTAQQATAARLLGTTTMTRTAVAQSVGIGKRTLYKWLEDPEFKAMIDRFRHGVLEKPDVNTIMSMLSDVEKEELYKRLSSDKDGLYIPEIHVIEQKIMFSDYPEQRNGIEEVGKLLGRLKRNILNEDGYLPDGSPDSSPESMRRLEKRIEKLKTLLAMTSNDSAYDTPNSETVEHDE